MALLGEKEINLPLVNPSPTVPRGGIPRPDLEPSRKSESYPQIKEEETKFAGKVRAS